MSRIRSLPPAVAALLLAASPALAQTPAADAIALQTAIHGFFDRMVGVPVVSDALTPKVTAEGDHLKLELAWAELGPIEGYKMGPGKITATAKPLSGGRWALDDVRIPDKLTGAGEITPAGATKPVPIGFNLAIAKQTGSMIFDPALATTSSADSIWTGYTMNLDSVQGTQISSIDSVEAHNVWQPRGDGRMDMRGEVIFSNYSITTPTPGGTPIKVVMNRVTQKAQAKNFAMVALGALLPELGPPVRHD